MVDIWALGCVLYALCFLRHPFETSSNLAIINSKIKFPQSVPSSKPVQVCTHIVLYIIFWVFMSFSWIYGGVHSL